MGSCLCLLDKIWNSQQALLSAANTTAFYSKAKHHRQHSQLGDGGAGRAKDVLTVNNLRRDILPRERNERINNQIENLQLSKNLWKRRTVDIAPGWILALQFVLQDFSADSLCFTEVKFMPRHVTVSQEKWWCLGNKTSTSLQHCLHRIISFLALRFYKHNTELYKKCRNKMNSLENPSWDLPTEHSTDLQWTASLSIHKNTCRLQHLRWTRKLWRAISSSPNSTRGTHSKIPPRTARSQAGGPQIHENTQPCRSHKCRMCSPPNTVVTALWCVIPESAVLCTGQDWIFHVKSSKRRNKKKKPWPRSSACQNQPLNWQTVLRSLAWQP